MTTPCKLITKSLNRVYKYLYTNEIIRPESPEILKSIENDTEVYIHPIHSRLVTKNTIPRLQKDGTIKSRLTLEIEKINNIYTVFFYLFLILIKFN